MAVRRDADCGRSQDGIRFRGYDDDKLTELDRFAGVAPAAPVSSFSKCLLAFCFIPNFQDHIRGHAHRKQTDSEETAFLIILLYFAKSQHCDWRPRSRTVNAHDG